MFTFPILVIINYLCGIIPHQQNLLVWHAVPTESIGAANVAPAAPMSKPMCPCQDATVSNTSQLTFVARFTKHSPPLHFYLVLSKTFQIMLGTSNACLLCSHCMVGTLLSSYNCSKNILQSFLSISGFHFINENHIRFMPHWCY